MSRLVAEAGGEHPATDELLDRFDRLLMLLRDLGRRNIAHHQRLRGPAVSLSSTGTPEAADALFTRSLIGRQLADARVQLDQSDALWAQRADPSGCLTNLAVDVLLSTVYVATSAEIDAALASMPARFDATHPAPREPARKAS